eukprot:scaffold273971_cov15-Tisochrysis_lutea.AAC.2
MHAICQSHAQGFTRRLQQGEQSGPIIILPSAADTIICQAPGALNPEGTQTRSRRKKGQRVAVRVAAASIHLFWWDLQGDLGDLSQDRWS